MKSSLLLTGIGLRRPHYTEFLQQRPDVAWIEVHSENYYGEGGKSLETLEKIRQHYPVSFHSVSLSLGSADELNWRHLKQLRDLISRIDPCLLSDHLSWSSIDGQYLHDLLPLPYTEEALSHLVSRIKQVQDYLQRQLLIENISSYVYYTDSQIPEQEFLNEVAKQSGCGILLDVNNVYVSSVNLGFNPETYITQIEKNLVQEIHLAGFTTSTLDSKEILIDSHNRPIAPAVWELFRKTIEHIGRKPTIIEWDTDLPTLDSLCLEAYRAEQIMREIYVPAKSTV